MLGFRRLAGLSENPQKKVDVPEGKALFGYYCSGLDCTLSFPLNRRQAKASDMFFKQKIPVIAVTDVVLRSTHSQVINVQRRRERLFLCFNLFLLVC